MATRKQPPLKVCHVIIGLHVGGAEMMLWKLLQGLDRERFDCAVIALMDGGEVAEKIAALGVPVHFLGLKSIGHLPAVLLKLRRLAGQLQPDTVQGWMYHGNIAATLLARWSGGAPDLVWNMRHSLADVGREKFLTRQLIRLGARWSQDPRRVIHNASVSIDQHAAVGYSRANACMIPNGFDTAVFGPNEEARTALRARLGLAADALLVGTLGRLHHLKGQQDFLRAAAIVATDQPTAHFVMAGRGVTDDAVELEELATASGLAGRVHLIGPESTPTNYLAGLDLFCLPSLSEGFPNVLGEAMSCGVPVVTTAVGEAPIIAGGWGEVVPPAEPAALAAALSRYLVLPADLRRERGLAGRQSIVDRYQLTAITAQYAALYEAGARPDLTGE